MSVHTTLIIHTVRVSALLNDVNTNVPLREAFIFAFELYTKLELLEDAELHIHVCTTGCCVEAQFGAPFLDF